VHDPDYDPPLEHCPLCDGPRLKAYDRDYRGHRIDRCAECGVAFMNPQYSDAHLRRFYSTYINVHDQGAPVPAQRRSQPEVRAADKGRCLDLMARHLAPGRVLMVGCGDGLELEVARRHGWSPEGYDIDEKTTAEVAQRSGVPVHCGRFERLPVPEGRFDAVFMDQVIEHPKNPADYLRKAHALLREGGVLFLGTPNIGSVSNRLKTWAGRLGLRRQRRGRHYNTKHHIFFYTPAVMRGLLARFGFEVLVVRGSLEPQRNPVTPLLSRWLPNLDSGFIALARKP
jgi:2-polyprenyl-3-methyl-5-hydroxy-6-metoxy-1,4-benzoquinol methylase